MSGENPFPNGEIIVTTEVDDFDDSTIISIGDDAATISVTPVDEESAVIDGLCVADEFRGQGLATIAIKEGLDYAKEAGFKEVTAVITHPSPAHVVNQLFDADAVTVRHYDAATEIPYGETLSADYALASLRDGQPVASQHNMSSLSVHYSIQLR